ncbi:hypothetical protein EBZ39_04895 [bacterium]|nr:hypothetical protein [bacterium]
MNTVLYVLDCGWTTVKRSLFLLGALVAAMVVYDIYTGNVVEDSVPETRTLSTSEVEKLDALVDEFLAITPRTKWREEFEDISTQEIADWFMEGAREVSLQYNTPSHRVVVEDIVAPRLKELMARSFDKIVANGMPRLDELDEALELAHNADRQKYLPAIVEILTVPELY